jgi:DNA mismatch repair ATPase MutS
VQALRHPIVENALKAAYVPNDFALGRDDQLLAVITGSNMGGKSTFIRSVAIAIVLCQIGCFVPCERATLGMFDSIQVRMFNHAIMFLTTPQHQHHHTTTFIRFIQRHRASGSNGSQ